MSQVASSSTSEAAEDETQDLFEIEDYYIASDLEGLIALFENLLKEWKPFLEGKVWKQTMLKRAQLSVEVEIIVSDSPESDPDHLIALLNIPIYINLIPRISSSVGNEGRYVLSAACMAAFSTGVDIPFIAACDECFWIGRSLSHSYQIELLDLNLPERLTNLSGILSVFYDLKGLRSLDHAPMITVEYAYESQQFDMDLVWKRNSRLFSRPERALKWGCSSKYRLLMRLLVRWTSFPEGTFTSNSFYTELDPLTAPDWQLSCQLDPTSKFHLSSTLERFLSACTALSEYATVNDILRRDQSQFHFQKIHEHVLACFREDDSIPFEGYLLRPTKSCPFGSLLSNLVVCMLQQYSHEPYRIVQIYYEFVSEVCRRWDEGVRLTGFNMKEETPIPDLNCCLIYQKLQVLDHCIKLRSDGTAGVGRQLISPVIERARHWADYDYDDLFDDLNIQSDQSANTTAEPPLSAELLPEGVNPDIELQGVFLLDGVTKMNVPITLESPLLTEDQIEEQQELMAGLGTDQASTAVRAEIQSSSLLSDMSAFKAANPGAKLGDFVRWYSPNDWIDGKGLSKRMSGTDNFWKRCWTRTSPCPASRQQPLFDHVAQGELILDYFKTISPSLLMEQISAIAISCSTSLIASVISTLPSTQLSKTASNLLSQKSDISATLKQIKEVEKASELIARLSGGTLKQTEIDSIIYSGSTTFESERERFLFLVREKYRSLGYPDHRLYMISAPCSSSEMRIAVKLDGGSLVTVNDAANPSQIVFCSALPL